MKACWEIPHPVRGKSLLPWLSNEGATLEGAPDHAVFSEHARLFQVSARTAGHRFLLGLESKQFFPSFEIVKNREELYPIPLSEKESRARLQGEDVVGKDPALRTRFSERVRLFLEDRMAYTADRIADEDYIRGLRELGYMDE